jgi:tRNA threonylcarbamoyl adenosine modification protein (Sua5/YciO/YrdC/YwlC family)
MAAAARASANRRSSGYLEPMRYRVDPERPAPRKVEPTIESVRRGNVIIYPTDTGYAFGCALSSAKGIHTLRRLKGIHEKHWKPLAMLVQSFNEIGRYGHMDNQTFRLMRRLLPGPYTLVLRSTKDVPRSMQNRHNEVGLRLPDHSLCAMLVEMLGEPLLTGSVTPSEQPPELEEPEQFEKRYRGDVAVVLDGGPMRPNPSTILRCNMDGIEVLREGQGPPPE